MNLLRSHGQTASSSLKAGETDRLIFSFDTGSRLMNKQQCVQTVKITTGYRTNITGFTSIIDNCVTV